MGADFLRWAHWLHARRIGAYLRLVALVNVAALVWLLATARGGVDRAGHLLGTDFLSFWTSGRMLVAGASPYDVAAHTAAQQAYFVHEGAHVAFFYPPPFLVVCHPLGLLPYFPSLALWLGLTGGACFLALLLWHGALAVKRSALLLFAAFPPVLVTITHGQTSFLAAALVGGGALLVRRRPWLAGVLFGLAIFKPQYGLLIPVVLLATRQWRTIAGACASALALGLVTSALYGPQVWADWFAISGQAGEAMANNAIGYDKLVSIMAGLMLIGAPSQLAMMVQVAVSLGIAASVALAGWRHGYTPALAAAMLAGTPLVTPFVLDYDLVLLGFPLLWLATREHLAWERIVTAAVFVAPAFARPLAMNAGVPIMAPLMCVFFWVVVRRALAGDKN